MLFYYKDELFRQGYMIVESWILVTGYYKPAIIRNRTYESRKMRFDPLDLYFFSSHIAIFVNFNLPHTSQKLYQ